MRNILSSCYCKNWLFCLLRNTSFIFIAGKENIEVGFTFAPCEYFSLLSVCKSKIQDASVKLTVSGYRVLLQDFVLTNAPERLESSLARVWHASYKFSVWRRQTTSFQHEAEFRRVKVECSFRDVCLSLVIMHPCASSFGRFSCTNNTFIQH